MERRQAQQEARKEVYPPAMEPVKRTTEIRSGVEKC
jgi:hypothetical protein